MVCVVMVGIVRCRLVVDSLLPWPVWLEVLKTLWNWISNDFGECGVQHVN